MVKETYLNNLLSHVFLSYLPSVIKPFQNFINTTIKQGGKNEEPDYSP